MENNPILLVKVHDLPDPIVNNCAGTCRCPASISSLLICNMKRIHLTALFLSTCVLLAACGGMRATSTVYQQIDEQEKQRPDFREAARQEIDRGQKLVSEGQAKVDDGRRQVREGQALITEGNDVINSANQMLLSSNQSDITVRRMLDRGTKMIRRGNTMVKSGNEAITEGQAMIRRGRELIEVSLEQLRRVAL